ncbi:MAG: xanthine dehydrogenase accessory protein XdhC [Silicimonas sp.]|nr:xanthine dehydrogenase accessory protein XdhC [Silicimonas sp.]
MSFALEDIQRLAPVARVVVAEAKGSVPRDAGTAMLVTAERVFGTIGGGTLEHEAIARARDVLSTGQDRTDRVPLGPGVGQCCGGAVTLVTELWDDARLASIEDVVARPVPGSSGLRPRAVDHAIAAGKFALIDGWLVEPVTNPTREIWIWGAGHVGRALVEVLAPLDTIRLRWADFDAARFGTVPAGVETLIAENPADLTPLAPGHADHIIVTHSHALDLDLCHRLLGQPFGSLGLIGSDTKWARFRKRLAALGHDAHQINRITCPIGDTRLGKHPQAIAIGVAGALIRSDIPQENDMGKRA